MAKILKVEKAFCKRKMTELRKCAFVDGFSIY